ncbi:unnamed protein product, partial [Closterium sp. NIES-65]
YIGGVHGDEPLGRQLLLYLADWLCNNYPSHPLAREVVEGVELHLLPAMNPDGFTLHTRENANRVDLNRAFPDHWFAEMNAEEAGRQAEVRAVMRWTQRHHFSASASLHGGALVASYAWDGTKDKGTHYAASPDDATFRLMATTYATAHPSMALSRDFPGGITNGASWYPLYGGMQDWNYVEARCMEITLELHIAKWPSPFLLPQLWEEHRPALLALLTTTAKMPPTRPFLHPTPFSSCPVLMPARMPISSSATAPACPLMLPTILPHLHMPLPIPFPMPLPIPFPMPLPIPFPMPLPMPMPLYSSPSPHPSIPWLTLHIHLPPSAPRYDVHLPPSIAPRWVGLTAQVCGANCTGGWVGLTAQVCGANCTGGCVGLTAQVGGANCTGHVAACLPLVSNSHSPAAARPPLLPRAPLYVPVTISHAGHVNHTTNVTVLAGRPTLLHVLLRTSSPPSLHAPSIFQTRSLPPPPPHPSGLAAWLPWHWGSKRGDATEKQGVRKGGGQGGRAGGADDPSLVLPSRQQAAAAAAAGGVLSSDEVMWAVGMGSSAALAAAVVAVVLLGGLLMMVGHRRRRFLFSHRGLPLRSLPKV